MLSHEEQEFLRAMRKASDDCRARGRTKGEAKGTAEALLIVLSARGIAVPDALHTRILADWDLTQLRRWLERAVAASSIDEALGDLTKAKYKTWDDDFAEGHVEGEANGKAQALLAVLSARGIAMPDVVSVRILAETDLSRLSRWIARAVTALSIDDVLAEQS